MTRSAAVPNVTGDALLGQLGELIESGWRVVQILPTSWSTVGGGVQFATHYLILVEREQV